MSYIEDNGYFIFGGVKSSDYGVWIGGGGTFNAPARRYKEYVVPGRNGTLTIDEGAYEEAEVTYPAFIARNFPANVEAFRNAIMAQNGYVRMTDSYHTNEYYLARYMAGLEADTLPGGRGGSFDLTFRRDPRRFLLSGDEPVVFTQNDEIENPTLFASNPFIRVTGDGTVNVGDAAITISPGYEYVDIDSEIQDCYCGLQNANALVSFSTGKFPTLQPGVNGITMSGNVTEVQITPRWFIL